MQISVRGNGNRTVFELNDSSAAQGLYDQLPLTVTVENHGNTEKIFYPPEELDVTDTPLVDNAELGTLAYYAPWGDVVMFYDEFGSASGLYDLGRALTGSDNIENLSGSIQIEQINAD